jgi:hypothetical protein
MVLRRPICCSLLGMLVSGCSSLPETKPAECAVGKRPGYFVPGDAARPTLLVGCARLGLSRKRIEFSLNLGRIGRETHVCVNPAFTGRGSRGFYIPAICKLNPPPARFAVRDLVRPRAGTRGYELVVWGTAPPATTAVIVRVGRRTARAAVFAVPAGLARRYGERPFDLFVVELPLRDAPGYPTPLRVSTTRKRSPRR